MRDTCRASCRGCIPADSFCWDRLEMACMMSPSVTTTQREIRQQQCKGNILCLTDVMNSRPRVKLTYPLKPPRLVGSLRAAGQDP